MQIPAMRIARELGLSPRAVDGDPRAAGAALADGFAVVDLKDEEGLVSHARRLKAEGGLSAVFTAGTDFSPAVALVASELGLPGIPLEVAKRAQDKGLMRRALEDAGVGCPRFALVSSAREAVKAAQDLPPPWVVKPVDSMGARGCVRVDAASGLEAACEEAIRYSRAGRAIVEEYLEGPEFSIDALVWEGEIIPCGIADRHIFFPPYFIEMGHTMPSCRPSAEIDEAMRTFEAGVRAIGIRAGAAKGDIKLCADGKARVGEIAARLSGGYMSGWTYPYASGVEATAGALRIAMGREPGDLKPRFNKVCSERAFISIPGIAREVRGIEAAKAVEGVRDLFTRVRAGSALSFPRNNVEKCGNVIAVMDDREKAVRAAESASRLVRIRLEPGRPETDAFLSSESSFPPSAFALIPRELSLSIDALPERVSGEGLGIGILDIDRKATDDVRDWQGMGLAEARDAALALTGAQIGKGRILLGKSFWKALVRGGYQGAAYVIDTAEKGLAEAEG
jgi:biotin carboxylase